jgi:hypothetical protein
MIMLFHLLTDSGGVMISDKGGYIDLQGNIMIPLIYDKLGIYTRGFHWWR